MTSLIIFGLTSSVLVILINIALVVVGVILSQGGSPLYAAIIKTETQEWERSPVESIFSSNKSTVCPNSTEKIQGEFYGIAKIVM